MSLVRLSLVLFLYQMLSDYEPDIGLLTSCLSGYYSGFSMIGELLSEFFLLVSLFQAVPNQWTSDEPKKDRSLVTNKQTSSDR